MKSLSSALLAAQKAASGLPVISSSVRTFGHPQKSGGSGGAPTDGIFPGLFNWTLLFSTDTIAPFYHGVAIPADGSLNRIRINPGWPYGVHHQRVANPSPGSNFGAAWTPLGIAWGVPAAIAAHGSEVIIAGYHSQTPPGVYYLLSGDNGRNFGEPTYIINLTGADCRRAIALAYKPDGTCAMVAAETTSNRIWFSRRLWGDNWTAANYFGSQVRVEGLAMYYDGDWNIIALINHYDQFRLARIVFGDGYRVSAGYWSPYEFLNLGQATTDSYELVQQYYDRAPQDRPELPDIPLHIRDKSGIPKPIPYTDRYGRRIAPTGYFQRYFKWVFQGLYSHSPVTGSPDWYKVSAILAARLVDNLALDAPFICKPGGAPPILSFYRNFEKWTVRLKPGSDFYDSQWLQAHRVMGACPYGMAIATDGTWLWGTRANEVWRTMLPARGWTLPPAGSGAGSSPIAISQADILSARETIRCLQSSHLELVLDNSKGQYAGLPTATINKGSMVSIAYGYRAPEDVVATPPNSYFIEDWTYDREPNLATITIRCIDAFGLLERYTIPGYQEYNQAGNELTVYDLISRLLQCIGGSLDYKSRSSDITTLYPRLTIHAGETGAALLRRLLALVPDVIYFNGVTGYIIHPQASDPSSYDFHFPDQGAGSYHYLVDGSYQDLPYQTNRVLIIGRDSSGNHVHGAAENTADINLVGERLDIKFNPTITTPTLAAQAAAATLARARLSARAGFITLPPHCGVELFDVITLHDPLCSQTSRNYRVMGIRTTFNQEQAQFIQHITLGAV